jgi:hypothetical protein
MRTPGSHHASGGKTKEERALADFSKSKMDKTRFEILRDDMNYTTWKIKFTFECKVQSIYRLIDPDFLPETMYNEHDIELYVKQDTYMWTVLLHVLRSTLAELILQDHMHESSAREAFFAFEAQETSSVNQTYAISQLSTDLEEKTLTTFQGTRFRFLTTWFELVKRLNDATDPDDQLTYTHARSMLARAVRSDVDLTRVFLSLDSQKDKRKAFSDMKEALCKEARNLDKFGKSRVAQNKPSASQIAAHLAQIGIVDEESVDLLVNRVSSRPVDNTIRLPSNPV